MDEIMREKRKGQVKRVMWTIILGVLGIFVYVTVNSAVGRYALSTQGAFIEEESDRIANAIDLLQSYKNAQIFIDLENNYNIEVKDYENEGEESKFSRKYIKINYGSNTAYSSPIATNSKFGPKEENSVYLREVKNLCITKNRGKIWIFDRDDPSGLPEKVDETCGLE